MKHISRFGIGLAAAIAAVPALAEENSLEAATRMMPGAVSAPIDRVPEARRMQPEASEANQSDRVFGGVEAAPGAWPFQVALLTTEMLDETVDTQFDAQFCGGSLIAPQWVLTAAHCISDGESTVPAESVTVLIGATSLEEGTRIQAAEIIAHPDYDIMTLDNDVGLIRLSQPADQPAIRLAGKDVNEGMATVIGWGRMENGYFPMNLMQTEIGLEPNAACNTGLKAIYKTDLANILWQISPRFRLRDEHINAAAEAIAANMGDPLTDNMICAGTTSGIRDACNGDSGGPLFVTGPNGPEQIGVVSWGDGPLDSEVACGHENAYGVYTRLSRYTAWIGEKTGIKP
jgi:secreted trypsin-like serine protease